MQIRDVWRAYDLMFLGGRRFGGSSGPMGEARELGRRLVGGLEPILVTSAGAGGAFALVG
jgi:hypothetical protein